MIGNKYEIIEFLQNKKEDIRWFIDKEKNKSSHTRQQQKTWYKLFNGISTHLGYNIEEVKSFLLAGTFGTHKMKLNTEEIEVPNESRTISLSKEQGTFFIETILAFVKLKDIPIKITSREIDSLYESFTN